MWSCTFTACQSKPQPRQPLADYILSGDYFYQVMQIEFCCFYFCIVTEKIVTNYNVIVIARSMLDNIRSYAELVGFQSRAKRHELSSGHTTSFRIVVGGLSNWVPRKSVDKDGGKGSGDG